MPSTHQFKHSDNNNGNYADRYPRGILVRQNGADSGRVGSSAVNDCPDNRYGKKDDQPNSNGCTM